MAETIGRVVDVASGFALVEIPRQTACGHCDARGSCGTGVLGKWLGRRALRVSLPNALNAMPGDAVVVAVPEGDVLALSVKAYLLPLAGLFLGGLGGDFLARALGWTSELPTIAAAALGLAAGLYLLGTTLAGRAGDGMKLLRKEPTSAPVVTLS